MKVRGDKMTNNWGLQIGKPSLNCCVPLLLSVSKRFKQENILLDVVKWVVSQSITKHGLFHNFSSIFSLSNAGGVIFCLKIILLSSCYFPSLFIFILLIHYSWCSELITGHCDKTKILNSTNMIFKGRNLSLVNLFCWH